MSPRSDRPRRVVRMPLRWQLVAVVLGLVTVTVVLMGLVAEGTVKRVWRARAVHELEAQRDRVRRSLARHFEQLEDELTFLAEDGRVAQALGGLRRASRQLEDDPSLQGDRIRPQMLRLRDHLLAYYAGELDAKQLRLESLLVAQRAAVWLQARYLAGDGDADVFGATGGADAYAAEHAVWHSFLSAAARRFGWEDLLLVELEDGNIVYDVAKTPVFQTGLLDGPYAISGLGSLFRVLRAGSAGDEAHFTDLAPFVPLHGRATAFAGKTIFRNGTAVGVLVAQISSERISALAQGEAGSAEDGVTIHVVGADGAPRGGAAGGGAALDLPSGLLDGDGTTGEVLRGDVPTLLAAAPLAVPGLGWSVVAERSESDVLRPLYTLRSALLVAALVALLLAAALGFVATTLVTHPLGRLLGALRAVARGENGPRANVRSGNELGAIGRGLDAIIERQEQGRQQEAAERARREQEIHEIVSVLQAANRGDASHRARVDGQLAGLANAVNATCASLGSLTDRLCGVPPRLVETGTTIQAAAEQMLRDAVRHVDEVAAAASRSEQLARRLRRSAETSTSAAERSRLVDEAARALDEAVRGLAAAFGRLQKSVGATSGRLKRLGDRSMEQSSLVGSIAKISADMNMLSLNAAIEASRAAQPGSGASLVADEVRKLAARAEAARDEIARAVETLQGEINETLAAMSRQAEHVERHAERVSEAEALLTSIIDAAGACAVSCGGAAQDVDAAAAETVGLQTTLAECRDGARHIRTIAEATHGHAQTLLAIAADLPAAVAENEDSEAHGAEANGNGTTARGDVRRGGARA